MTVNQNARCANNIRYKENTRVIRLFRIRESRAAYRRCRCDRANDFSRVVDFTPLARYTYSLSPSPAHRPLHRLCVYGRREKSALPRVRKRNWPGQSCINSKRYYIGLSRSTDVNES